VLEGSRRGSVCKSCLALRLAPLSVGLRRAGGRSRTSNSDNSDKTAGQLEADLVNYLCVARNVCPSSGLHAVYVRAAYVPTAGSAVEFAASPLAGAVYVPLCYGPSRLVVHYPNLPVWYALWPSIPTLRGMCLSRTAITATILVLVLSRTPSTPSF